MKMQPELLPLVDKSDDIVGNDDNSLNGSCRDSPTPSETLKSLQECNSQHSATSYGSCNGTLYGSCNLELPDSPLLASSFNKSSSSSSAVSFDRRQQFRKTPSMQAVTESFRKFRSQISELIAAHTGEIGYLGSIAIAVNSLTGPAMLTLPSTFERSGIIPTTCTLILVCILSAFCCMHMANTISKVPNNGNFKQEVEFSETFRQFWGKRGFILTQIVFFCCITCLNISSIVDTSQVVDSIFGHWWPWGGALGVRVKPSNWRLGLSNMVDYVTWDYSACATEDINQGFCTPFVDNNSSSSNYHNPNSIIDTVEGDVVVVNEDGFLFTIGTLITTTAFLPLALMDLKENSMAQILGFCILLMNTLQFIIQFALSPSLSFENASWWGSSWSDLLGVVLFNFALVIVIPAWLYERQPHVKVGAVIHGSSALALLLYLAVGILGNMAMPHASENMLESFMSGSMGLSMQIGASIFAFFIIGLGTPLFSVLTRLNLTGSGLVSRRTGNLLAVYFPFGAAWILRNCGSVTKLLSWGGTIFTGMVVFILPLVLAIHVVLTSDNRGTVSVYFGFCESKKSQLYSLYALLTLTALSLTAAIAGMVWESHRKD